MKKKIMYFFFFCMIIGTCFGCGKNEQTEAESKASDNTEAVVMTETESGISEETDENAEMQSEQIETGGEDSWEDSADGWD